MPTIAKTPLRISLFGGGTDYPEYWERHGGVVLGGTIDKFIYQIHLPTSSIAEKRYCLTYDKVEAVNQPGEIKHPIIREVLLDEKYDEPFNLAVISDIPGNAGLGSSSAFTIGFLSLIRYLKGEQPTKLDLARAAFRVEAEILRKRVGVQDQYHAAFGGLSLYEFSTDRTTISPIQFSTEFRDELNAAMVLVHTQRYRYASDILKGQIQATEAGEIDSNLGEIKSIAYAARDLLQSPTRRDKLPEIGRMLSSSWEIKRSLSPSISNSDLDDIYQKGMQLGAYGGKLAGAGGGGFFIFLMPPEGLKKLKATFGDNRVIDVRFQDEGTRLRSVSGWA